MSRPMRIACLTSFLMWPAAAHILHSSVPQVLARGGGVHHNFVCFLLLLGFVFVVVVVWGEGIATDSHLSTTRRKEGTHSAGVCM